MVDKEQRTLLIVPYALPPPPRGQLIAAAIFTSLAAIAVLGLFMADYSAATTTWLVGAATTGFMATAVLLVTGIGARLRFRREMERAVEPMPVRPVGDRSDSIEAV